MKIYVIRVTDNRTVYIKYILAEHAFEAYQLASKAHENTVSLQVTDTFPTDHPLCFSVSRIESVT